METPTSDGRLFDTSSILMALNPTNLGTKGEVTGKGDIL